MKTSTISRSAVIALALVLGLSGCGKEASGLNENPGDASEFVDESIVTATTGFGATGAAARGAPAA